MRRQVAWFAAAVLLGVLGTAGAARLDEASIVGQVSAADHEVEQGYFSLGDSATVIAKPVDGAPPMAGGASRTEGPADRRRCQG